MFQIPVLASRLGVRRFQTNLSYLQPCLQFRAITNSSKIQAQDDLSSGLLVDINKEELNPPKVARKRGPRKKATAVEDPPLVVVPPKPTATRRKRATKAKDEADQEGSIVDKKVVSKQKAPRRSRIKNGLNLTPEEEVAKAQQLMLKEIKTQRIPLSLLEDPWQDVTRYLGSAYKSTSLLGDNKRAHVISESLCDDALERLGPTLDRHIGCDIIDINPGVCLWSSKLHARLKPRKHILLEPDEKLYRPFLLPLLGAPGSKYELVPKSGIVWSHLETVLSKQSLPFQERYEKGDPRLEEPNDTLLVLANLGYYPMKPYRGFSSLASLVLYQFISATRAHSLFQRYGRVRFMVWTNDEEKRHLLPREIHQRRKTAVEAEIAFEKINEIASSTEDKGPFQREKRYDLNKGRDVLKKMKDTGLRTPEGRESVLAHEIANPPAPGSVDSEAVWSMSAAMVRELRALEAAVEAGEIQSIIVGGKTKESPQHRRLRILRSQYNFIVKRQELFGKLLQEFDSISSLQKDLHCAKLAGEDIQEREAQFAAAIESWRDESESLPEHFQNRLNYLLDNHRTIAYDPPLLTFDRREFEPLLVRSEEFYPAQPMCLLDFHPRKLWPVLQDDSGNNNDVFEFILGTFFHLPAQSVQKALRSLWPGAYEWIINECPSLTDPAKGGAPDLEMLTVRSLTEDMLEEIITAWSTWPFRPSKYELLGRMGATGYNPDELEVE